MQQAEAATATGGDPEWQVLDVDLGLGGVVERYAMVDASGYSAWPLIGLSWMQRHAAVIDCDRQLLAWPPTSSVTMGGYDPTTLHGRGYAEIPLRAESRLLWCEADIAGRTGRILVDTGSMSSVLDRAVASALGIEDPDPPRVMLEQNGAMKPALLLGRTLPTSLAIGALSERWSFLTFDFTALNSSLRTIFADGPEASTPRVECIMGMDFLIAHRAIIDVGRQRLFLLPPPAAPSSGAPLPLRGPHRRLPGPTVTAIRYRGRCNGRIRPWPRPL